MTYTSQYLPRKYINYQLLSLWRISTMRSVPCFLSILLLPFGIWAQKIKTQLPCRDSLYCTPGVRGMSPGKGLDISYERLPDYEFPTSDVRGQGSFLPATAGFSRKLNTRIKIPLVWKKDWTILLGGRYSELAFSDDTPELDDYYVRNSAAGINVLKSLSVNRYLAGSAEIGWNKFDFGLPDGSREQRIYALTLLYGMKKNANTEWAFGVYQRIRDDRYAIYPIIMYNHTFNRRWGIETVLPAKAHVRYNFSGKSILYAGAELDGSNYFVSSSQGTDFADQFFLQSRNTGVRIGLEYEKQLLPILWLGARAGYLARLGAGNQPTEIDPNNLFAQSGRVYSGVSLSIRPPR